MATKQGNNLISEETKLTNQLIKAEEKLNAERKNGEKADKKKLDNLEKEVELAEDKLYKFKLANTEAKTSINLAKTLANQAKEHSSILFRQKGVYDNIKNIGTEIAKLAKSKDKFDKKVVKNYQTTLDLTESIMHNSKAIGTEEFQKVNLTSQLVKLKKLEAEASEGTKGGITETIKHLELMKEAQDIMEAQHESAKSAADAIMSPFKFITDTMGNVPLIGGLVQKTLGSQVQNLTDSLSAKIGSALSEGMEKAPADVGKDAEKQFRKDTKGEFTGKGHQAARGKAWEKEKKHREDNAKMSEKDVTAAKMRGKMMAASIAGLAVVAGLWAKIGKYAMDTGLSLAQTAKLGPQLIINSQAVEAFADEFGTVGELSTGLSIELRKQRALYGVAEKDVAKLAKLQQGMTGATKEQIVADLPGMYKDARRAGVSPAKLMENMAGSSEFLAKYVGGSVKEMGAFAIEAAKSGVSLQSIEQSMKGALDWESSITKEMEASVLLGKQISLDKFRELSFNEDGVGALAEQMRILRSLGPLDQLRLDQKEALAGAFSMEFSQIVALQRQQDILNSSVDQQKSLWQSVVGISGTGLATMVGALPGILTTTSQIGMTFSGMGISLKGVLGKLKSMKIVQKTLAALGMRTAAASIVEGGGHAAASAAKIPYVGWLLAAGAMGSIMTLGFQYLAKGKAQGKAKGGPVKGMNPYMVGEKGPELFIPTMGGNIIPNDKLAGGTADRVYGDTSKQDAKFDTMIGLLQQANTDRNEGNRKGLMGIEGLGGM
jgi:hypothetical protein